jgi:predicted secreted protein
MAERGRDKSRTPKETKEKEKKEKDKGREAKAKDKEKRKEEDEALKKALVFSPETPQTQFKKTRFQDDTEAPKEHQLVVRKEKDESASSSNRQRAPAMKLTTERLEQMTVNSPMREDGTKTPLKIPPQPQRTRNTSSALSSGTEDSELENTEAKEEEEKKDPAKMTLDEMKAELTRLRRHREDQDNTEKRIHEIDQSLKET